MTGILDFYSTPGALTRGGRREWLLDRLPHELGELVDLIHGLAIYDVVAADFYDVEVPDARRNEIHYRRFEHMLTAALVLDDAPLDQARPPQRRLLTRCAGFTRLLVGALRHHGVAARSRCGFATYFNPGHFEDHWVAEVWDRKQARWRLVDAQLDTVWRDRLQFDDDVLDLDRHQFLPAADAWRRCRSGELDSDLFGISFNNLHGLWFIAGNLVRDLAALNKFEMLPWDVWGSQPAVNDTLSAQQLAYFDDLARLTLNPDATFDRAQERFMRDHQLRVPSNVFNALLQREECI
jgi:hypothetical protein